MSAFFDPYLLPDEIGDACLNCGECCRIKFFSGSLLFSTPEHCRFFDAQAHRCLVYEERFLHQPDCLRWQEAVNRKVFPKTCGIAKKIKGYKPRPELRIDAETLDRIEKGDFLEWEELKKHLEGKYPEFNALREFGSPL